MNTEHMKGTNKDHTDKPKEGAREKVPGAAGHTTTRQPPDELKNLQPTSGRSVAPGRDSGKA